MESETEHLLTKRIMRAFKDIVILRYLKENNSASGYEIAKYLHENFKAFVSQGAIYAKLYQLERENLLKGRVEKGTRVYKLTGKGRDFLRESAIVNRRIQAVVSSLLSGD